MTTTILACNVCQSDQLRPHPGKDGYEFQKCHDCGYVFASPMPSPEQLAELYDSAHFNSSYNPESSAESPLFQQRLVQYEQDRDYFLRFASKGRLLDYGCGNGLFLNCFPESFERYGYEFNRVTTEFLHRERSFHVVDHESGLEQTEDGFFDAVTMRGVIEHLIDPEAALALLASKLKAGGHLFICATPNIDSPCALLYGVDWSQFTPPYHLHYFSPRTLSLMAARHGLALVDSATPYLGTPYEQVENDATRFVGDVEANLNGEPLAGSAPFPGTMMSLVFRKV